MKTAVLHISKLTPNGLVAKSIFIQKKMTGNPAFPTPTPTMIVVDAATNAVEDQIAVATDGGHTAHVDLHIKVTKLATLLVELGAYVTLTADGNEAKILSAGFDVRKKRELIGELPAPQGLTVKTPATPGRLVARWTPVDGAYMYQIFINEGDPNDEKSWRQLDSISRASYILDGLTTGKTIWLRVNCMGAAGISPMSDPAKGVPV